MCPLAVAGLQLRYLLMSSSVKFGHPFKKPRQVAFNRVDIVGLHRDWWANFTALARVRTEWENPAIAGCLEGWGTRPSQGPGCGRKVFPWVVPTLCFGIGRVHRSVVGSFTPRKIMFPLYSTSHFNLSNITCNLHCTVGVCRSKRQWPSVPLIFLVVPG
jgi:hypothetical protein